MAFPAQDPFWTETEAFIRKTLGTETPFIAPREFYHALPRVFSYDWVHAIDILGDFAGFAVHKGLLHEIPLPVLLHLRAEWKCVFANAVFLFYVPPSTDLPLAAENHQRFFFEQLDLLQQEAEAQRTHVQETTALLVVASHSATFLNNLLRSTDLLHVPVLVVAVTADTNEREAYRDVCSQHNAHFEGTIHGTSVDQALKAGLQKYLENPDISWICTLDDTMLVRPDFVSVVEKFRTQNVCSHYGGLWTKADGTLTSASVDGFQVVVPLRENTIHCYGHRDYWNRKLSLKRAPSTPVWRRWRKLLFGEKHPSSLIIRDLVTFQATD